MPWLRMCGRYPRLQRGGREIRRPDPEGRTTATIGRLGGDDGQLNQPSGVAVDAAGNVYVTDQTNRIQVFAPVSSSSAVFPTRAMTVSSLSASPTPAGGAQVVFSLSASARAEVSITNIAGRVVRVLATDLDATAGLNTLTWDGNSDRGLRAPNGKYLVRVIARSESGEQQQAIAACEVRR